MGSIERGVTGVEPTPAGDPLFALTVDERERAGTAGLLEGDDRSAPRRSTERWSAGAGGILLHARTSPLGAAVFEPPLVILPPDAAPGRRWRVGRAREGALTFDLEGEALAVEDVATDAGTQRGCLRVRHHGSVSSSDEEGMGAVRGRYERELWLCPGIGIAREVVRTDVTGPSSAGAERGRTSDVVTSTLVRADLADR